MDRFGVLDYLIFLSQGPPIILVAGMFVAAVSCIVAFIAITLSRS
jgi:hypothetical protein